MQVTIRAAKANLSKLIDAALSGEDVVIARGRKPVVKIIPIGRSPFKVGCSRGKLLEMGRTFSRL
ncbi:type II toxin-antitoxin system antitoxin Phd/YefM family protein [Rhizobium phaseoli]|nr:type II toxin-antitoxin system antitoxin Phd/YefM family protein [Rhizobium phaseoli]ANL72987.1 type II toxin-antitoxin system antitoxin Phd/YefM family protein [Rhizobium phaseoli]ANM05193.1 type II toxin-antitoxin system antitoxin Phd/YefM family protein [Rhizobium phaseoli]